MGSGKSTIGALLSQEIKYDFSDLDTIIEDHENMEISGIFEVKGESYFRKSEREMLLRVRENDSQVIALGGGTLLDDENIRFVKENGLLIWLDVQLDQIKSRLKEKESRPLFESDLTKLDKLYMARIKGYESADIVVSNRGSEQETLTEIINKIEEKDELSFRN